MAAAAPATSAYGAFAFSDLSGFTAFTAERGDDAAIGLVETFRSHMSEGLPPSARIVNRIGDGLLVHFAEASTAVSSLLALTHRCAEVSTPEVPLWIRTGVHVGTARVLGDDLIGHDVNVAARIGELAGATEVLVSESARDQQTDDSVRFDALGPVFVKGLTEALRVYRASTVEATQPAPATT
jgi:adenylate cyclase